LISELMSLVEVSRLACLVSDQGEVVALDRAVVDR